MSDDFWKEEEKKDKKFMKEFDKEMDELYESVEEENLVCNEKCIHNIGNTCSIDDWSCRIKLDKKRNEASLRQKKSPTLQTHNGRFNFPSSTALMKSLYLSTLQVTKKWNQPIHGWGSVYNEFCIMYEGRMPE